MWTLLHFIWQGTILVVLLESITQPFGVRSIAVRYRLALTTLVLMAACLPITFWAVPAAKVSGSAGWLSNHAPFTTDVLESPGTSLRHVSPETPSGRQPANCLRAHASHLATWQPYLLVGWAIGAGLVSLRLMIGGTMVWQLQHSREPLGTAWVDRTTWLAARLGLPQVRVFISQRVRQSVVTGLWRPVVLVPAAWLTQMTPEMLECVLAHEFAHVRRLDLWAILLQRLVETFLFYHPAVWWLSRRLSREREMCCDAMAVAATGDRLMFTKALQWAVQGPAAGTNAGLTAAWKGSQTMILERVRRVLEVESAGERCSRLPLGLALLIVPMMLALLAIGRSQSATVAAEPQAEMTGQSRSAASTNTPQDVSTAPRDGNVTSVGQQEGDVMHTLARPRSAPVKTNVASKTSQNPHPMAGSYVGPDGYRIEPPDILGLEVRSLTSLPRSRDESSDPAELAGNYLVGADGRVDLRRYGTVSVAGKTLSDARLVIEEHLRHWFDSPAVSLDVVSYNSKCAYVVFQTEDGDYVYRLPVNNSSTVASVILQVEGAAARAAKGSVWLSRPISDASSLRAEVKQIDWQAIVERGSVEANLPLTPGDRIFIGDHWPEAKVMPRLSKSPATREYSSKK